MYPGAALPPAGTVSTFGAHAAHAAGRGHRLRQREDDDRLVAAIGNTSPSPLPGGPPSAGGRAAYAAEVSCRARKDEPL
jgi:hypothetical protein